MAYAHADRNLAALRRVEAETQEFLATVDALAAERRSADDEGGRAALLSGESDAG